MLRNLTKGLQNPLLLSFDKPHLRHRTGSDLVRLCMQRSEQPMRIFGHAAYEIIP